MLITSKCTWEHKPQQNTTESPHDSQTSRRLSTALPTVRLVKLTQKHNTFTNNKRQNITSMIPTDSHGGLFLHNKRRIWCFLYQLTEHEVETAHPSWWEIIFRPHSGKIKCPCILLLFLLESSLCVSASSKVCSFSNTFCGQKSRKPPANSFRQNFFPTRTCIEFGQLVFLKLTKHTY